MTRGGGTEPVVSWDGRHIFYAKQAPTEGIWRVPAEGGEEIKIVPRGQAPNFDVAENGIFMMDPSAKPQVTVEKFSFASYLTVTRDGRSMLYTRLDSWMSDIEMLPGFR